MRGKYLQSPRTVLEDTEGFCVGCIQGTIGEGDPARGHLEWESLGWSLSDYLRGN